MHEIFIARQPIFDRNLRLFAYELLFRHADADHANVIDADSATSQVILNAFTVIGLDELVGDGLAFINFTRNFLVDQHRLPFPGDRVVLEVLEGTEPDAELIAALTELRAQGLRLSLDDFVFHEGLLPLVKLADIIKVEVSLLSEAELRDHVDRLRPHSVKLLAEKVETQEQYELCRGLGFDYFQGYFLSRPRTLRRNALPIHRLPALDLLAAVHRPEVDLAELERVIGRDVTLSYKLLRYLNSAFFADRRQVESISQALRLLSLGELRAWASLIALAAVAEKPPELLLSVMTRAKLCEGLAERLGFEPTGYYFTVGLYSGLDSLLDAPLADVVESLHLGEEWAAAVLRHTGPAGRLLECALCYERGDWERILSLDIDHEALAEAYLAAIHWVEEMRRSWERGRASERSTHRGP